MLTHSPTEKDQIATGSASDSASCPAARSAAPLSNSENSVRGLWRVVYLVFAGLFFILALLGAALPGLPTTPFLLLTSFFLARSSTRIHQLLLNNRIFGPMLRHWQRHRTVEPRIKIRAALLVVLSMVFLVVFSSLTTKLLVPVVLLAAVGLLVIYRLPTHRCMDEPNK